MAGKGFHEERHAKGCRDDLRPSCVPEYRANQRGVACFEGARAGLRHWPRYLLPCESILELNSRHASIGDS